MAFCAVAMLPLGSDNPRALIAADTQCDGPAANAVWLIGTHHKTGTELNNEIMRRLPEGCKRDTCGIVEKCMTTEPECITAAVTAAGGGGVAFAEHLSIASVGMYADIIAAATEGAGSPLLRVAHWVRDPTEIIMSGFFYHKVTDELWVHANGTLAQKWFDACEAGEDGAAQTACSAAINLEASVRSGSYQELLNALSDEEGVLVEAWRAGEELAEMNATMHVLGSFPKQSITVDLGEAEAECERVFGLVFEARRTAPRTQPTAGGESWCPPFPAVGTLNPTRQCHTHRWRAGTRKLTYGQRIGVRAAGLLQGRRWESRSPDGPGPGESSHGAHQVAGGAGVVWKASAALPGEHAVRCAKRRRGDISEGWLCDAVLDTGARLGVWWEPGVGARGVTTALSAYMFRASPSPSGCY